MRAVHDALRASGGRAVPTDNLHVTLAFLGSVVETRIPELTAIARRVAEEFPPRALPIELTLTRVEWWRKPQLLCAVSAAAADGRPGDGVSEIERPGAATSATLLATALKDQTTRAGLTPDLKPFRPHVTLARKVLRAIRSGEMHPVSWSFTQFALVESRTDPAGAAYRVIEVFALSSRAR